MKLIAGSQVPKGFAEIADLFHEPPQQITRFILGKKGETPSSTDHIVHHSLDELSAAAFEKSSEGASLTIKSIVGYENPEVRGPGRSAPPLQSIDCTKGSVPPLRAHLLSVRAKRASSVFRETHFENCEIGILVPNSEVRRLHLSGGRYGVLDLSKLGAVIDAEVILEGCEILEIRVGSEFAIRNLVIDDVTFPAVAKRWPTESDNEQYRAPLPKIDRASFGHLGEWAKRTGSSDVAHFARDKELEIERSTSKGLYWLWLVCWGAFSEFGLAPIRPMIWLLLFALLNAVLVCTTGSEIGLPNSQLNGWRAMLVDQIGHDGMERALVSSFEGLTTPLSGLSGRRLVVPDNPFAAVFQIIYGFFAIGMVSLTILSLRRRFKV